MGIILFVLALAVVVGVILHKQPWTNPASSPMDYVEIRQGDITKMGLSCIVNAANRFGLGGGGVDGAIHRAAGPELREWIKANIPCWEVDGEHVRISPPGSNFVSPGFSLCGTIIHTVGPIWDPAKADECETALIRAYKGGIMAAKEEGFDEVAFPLISTGIYGYPLEDAIKTALVTCALMGKFHEVSCVLVAYDDATFQVLEEQRQSLKEWLV